MYDTEALRQIAELKMMNTVLVVAVGLLLAVWIAAAVFPSFCGIVMRLLEVHQKATKAFYGVYRTEGIRDREARNAA